MICLLRKIFGLIKTVLQVIAEVVAWLLIKFYLWIPIVFAVSFIIVCAIARISIKEWQWLLYAGTGACLVLSAVLFFARFLRKGKKDE